MWMRATRWVIAALIGSAVTTIGCAPAPAEPIERAVRTPIVADASLVHAFDTDVESRVIDRFELDHYLSERNIQIEVIDGVVCVTGDVWTALEKQRVGELIRNVVGMIDVVNELDIRPPR
jgi:hypothetical protein